MGDVRRAGRRIAVWALITLAIPRVGLAQEAAPDELAAVAPTPPPETRPLAIPPVRKNHFIPFFDIVVFDSLLNRYGEHFVDRDTYDVGTSSITRNLHSLWVLDSDPFSTNQFMHPYQGATYHALARSAGLNYWESLGYTFAGSMLWEIAGETTHSIEKRSDRERHRRELPGRAAVSDGEPGARKVGRVAAVLA